MRLKDVEKRKFDPDQLMRQLRKDKKAKNERNQEIRQNLSSVDPIEYYEEYKELKTRVNDLEYIVGLLRVKCRV